jgi:hypothetical protein
LRGEDVHLAVVIADLVKSPVAVVGGVRVVFEAVECAHPDPPDTEKREVLRLVSPESD